MNNTTPSNRENFSPDQYEKMCRTLNSLEPGIKEGCVKKCSVQTAPQHDSNQEEYWFRLTPVNNTYT